MATYKPKFTDDEKYLGLMNILISYCKNDKTVEQMTHDSNILAAVINDYAERLGIHYD